MLKKSIEIDKIYSSSAERAIRTSITLAKGIDYPLSKINNDNTIYAADAELLLTLCVVFPDKYDTIMVVGHNPALKELYNRLTNSDIDKFGTSNIACMVFDTEQWMEIPNSAIVDKWIINPKID